MSDEIKKASVQSTHGNTRWTLHTLFLGLFGVAAACLLAALFVPKGFALTAFDDTLQMALVAVAAALSFRNFLRTHYRTRIFWFLVFTSMLLWTASDAVWAFYEVLLKQPIPDLPSADILLFLKVVPLTGAVIIAPDRKEEAHFRAFGLLDVFVLMIYSLYLFTFGVYAYRLLPGAEANYNFYFNLADAIGNQTLVVVVAIAFMRAKGQWRNVYRVCFVAAGCYALASDLINVAIDAGRYYTGSLYDVPLIASLALFACVPLAGQAKGDKEEGDDRLELNAEAELANSRITFLSEHAAMLVGLSTPVIGIWLLSSASAPVELRSFRLVITLVTIFFLTLLLSIKEDILTTGLLKSLQKVSETYSRIDRFKSHLTQSEKLATLGELVAQVARQIKGCMATILESSRQLTSRGEVDPRVRNMAGKIAQYAQRTDVLVDKLLHFAKETPLRLAPLDVKPVLESALHLSRIAKLANIRVSISVEEQCPQTRGDSSRLLLVFLQLISNAVDALSETQGGTLDIRLRSDGSRLILEFADSGPGIKEPQLVFEPFYTTKPVGQGTGLGLSTCYGIIQQHGGDIFCRNRPEGGAIVTVALPLAQQTPSEDQQAVGTLVAEGVR